MYTVAHNIKSIHKPKRISKLGVSYAFLKKGK